MMVPFATQKMFILGDDMSRQLRIKSIDEIGDETSPPFSVPKRMFGAVGNVEIGSKNRKKIPFLVKGAFSIVEIEEKLLFFKLSKARLAVSNFRVSFDGEVIDGLSSVVPIIGDVGFEEIIELVRKDSLIVARNAIERKFQKKEK